MRSLTFLKNETKSISTKMTLNNSQKLLTGFLALILVAGMASPAFAALQTNGDDVPFLDIQPSAIVPLVDCDEDTGTIVAFETSMGQSSNSHSTWVGDLQANGFTVVEMDINANGISECIDKIVIPSGDAGGFCIVIPYPAGDVTEIVDWVNDGGELVLLNEWNGCGVNTDPIATALGEPTANEFFSMSFVSGTNFDPANPAILFSGVTTWTTTAGNEYGATADAVVTDGVFPAGDPSMIAKTFGDGCVLMTGDSNWAVDGFIDVDDNRNLALNAIHFVNHCFDVPIGGTSAPVSTTALLVAGAQANMGLLSLALVGIVGAAAAITYKIKSKKTEQ